MGLLDFLKKDRHKDWILLSRSNVLAFTRGFTTEELRDAVFNIDAEKTLTLQPCVLPEKGCVCVYYEKNEKTKKLCFHAAFEGPDGYTSYISENMPPEEAYRIMSAYLDLGIDPETEGWTVEKHLKNMEPATFIQFVMMFTGDKDILARMEDCSAAPLNYLKNHKEIIPPDDTDENYAENTYNRILNEGPTKANTEYILLNAFAYEMYTAGIMTRVTEAPDIDEFAAAVEPFARKFNLPFDKKWFDPDLNDGYRCAVLEEKWHYDGFVIIEPHTRSSVYYYYICPYEEREEILFMAKRAGVDIITSE